MPDAIDSFTPTRRHEPDDDASPPARAASSPVNHARAASANLDDVLSSWLDAPHADYSVASRNSALRADKATLPRGIELASLATVPATNPRARSAIRRTWLHAQMQANAGGSSAVAYYAAFNRESQRVDYVVKPEAVEAFKGNMRAYETEANLTMMYGGPARAYQKESVRVNDAAARGEWSEAATHLASAWSEAVRDPECYAEVGVSAATAYAGTLTRAAPALRSVTTGAAVRDAVDRDTGRAGGDARAGGGAPVGVLTGNRIASPVER